MKKNIILLYFCAVFVANAKVTITEGSKLKSNVNRQVVVVGKVLHICPISGNKLKLQLKDNDIVTILPCAKEEKFDNFLNGKMVSISGKLEMQKLYKTEIESNYSKKKLLCHIDYSPCIDSEYIKTMWEKGYAEASLDKTNSKLQNKMEKGNKDYIPIYLLKSEKISILNNID